MGHGCLRLATAAMFVRSCVVPALCCGDGPRHSLHAAVWHRECNKDLILSYFSHVKKSEQYQLQESEALGVLRCQFGVLGNCFDLLRREEQGFM